MANWTLQSSNTPVQLILDSWDHYPALEPTSTHSFLYFIAVTGIHRQSPAVVYCPRSLFKVPCRPLPSPAVYSNSSTPPPVLSHLHTLLSQVAWPMVLSNNSRLEILRTGTGHFPPSHPVQGSLQSVLRAPGRLGTLE